MNPIITQPATVTDMRRAPKELLDRVKKEGLVPILTHSKFEVVMISIDKLNDLYQAIKDLKHELFVQEVLDAEASIERGEGHSFSSVDEMMEHLTGNLDEDEN